MNDLCFLSYDKIPQAGYFTEKRGGFKSFLEVQWRGIGVKCGFNEDEESREEGSLADFMTSKRGKRSDSRAGSLRETCETNRNPTRITLIVLKAHLNNLRPSH